MLVLLGTSVILLKQILDRILTVWGGAGKMLHIGSEDIRGGRCFIHYQHCIFYHQKITDVPDEVRHPATSLIFRFCTIS